MGRFCCGQIVLAYVDDGKGHTKERPCMILTRDADLLPGEPIQVVAITKDIGESPQPYWVHVPHAWPTHLQTGLYKPSVAKCNWIREIEENRIIKVLGNMTDPQFELILDCIDVLLDTADFDDWI